MIIAVYPTVNMVEICMFLYDETFSVETKGIERGLAVSESLPSRSGACQKGSVLAYGHKFKHHACFDSCLLFVRIHFIWLYQLTKIYWCYWINLLFAISRMYHPKYKWCNHKLCYLILLSPALKEKYYQQTWLAQSGFLNLSEQLSMPIIAMNYLRLQSWK